MSYSELEEYRRILMAEPRTVAPSGPLVSRISFFHVDHIYMRLRMTEHELRERGIEIVHLRVIGGEVHAIIGRNDDTIILKDGKDLFPSDDFITRIRVLL